MIKQIKKWLLKQRKIDKAWQDKWGIEYNLRKNQGFIDGFEKQKENIQKLIDIERGKIDECRKNPGPENDKKKWDAEKRGKDLTKLLDGLDKELKRISPYIDKDKESLRGVEAEIKRLGRWF